MPKNKLIPTPEKLWEYFEEYKKNLKEHPFIIKDWVGKDATEVERERERPITLVGFSNFLANKGVIDYVMDYFTNKEGAYEEFVHVCRRIKNVRSEDHEEGAMISKYHHGVTARLNGWSDKIESTVNNNVKLLNLDPLATTDNGTKENSGTKEAD